MMLLLSKNVVNCKRFISDETYINIINIKIREKKELKDIMMIDIK